VWLFLFKDDIDRHHDMIIDLARVFGDEGLIHHLEECNCLGLLFLRTEYAKLGLLFTLWDFLVFHFSLTL
jgi:hypothetical protein